MDQRRCLLRAMCDFSNIRPFLCQIEDDSADCSAGGSDSAAPNRMEDEANYLQ